MSKLRTFDEMDWAGWAGANEFPDGTGPLIGDAPDGRIVIVSYDPERDEYEVVVIHDLVKTSRVYYPSLLLAIDAANELLRHSEDDLEEGNSTSRRNTNL